MDRFVTATDLATGASQYVAPAPLERRARVFTLPAYPGRAFCHRSAPGRADQESYPTRLEADDAAMRWTRLAPDA